MLLLSVDLSVILCLVCQGFSHVVARMDNQEKCEDRTDMLSIPMAKPAQNRSRARMTDELRRKILFTIALVLAYRVGSYIPVPGLPFGDLMGRFSSDANVFSAVSALNMFSGGALSRMSLFALGTMPYITAQIIVQMLGTVIPAIEKAQKDGDVGRRQVNAWTRYLTVAISFVNAVAYVFLISGWGVNYEAGAIPAPISCFMIVATMVVGALIVMWLGELITTHGVGNGMSLLIGINILSGIPSALISSWNGGEGAWVVAAVLLVTCATIPLIVLVERGQRRVPITYSKQIRGNAVMGGGSTYLPIKVNMAGVIPIIFASTLLALPSQAAVFFPNVAWVQHVSYLLSNGWVSWVASAILIVFFSYFYTTIVFDADETAENIKRQGGFVPGFRPGKTTANYLRNIVNNITLPGAVFMAALSVIPSIAYSLCGASLVNTFGGTSTLIMVGVVLDTAAAIESQMLDYDGFFS